MDERRQARAASYSEARAARPAGQRGAATRSRRFLPQMRLASRRLPSVSAPVRFEADRPGIAVAGQCPDLPRPVDGHLAERTPRRGVAVYHAVLGVDVDHASGREGSVPVRERLLSQDGRVGRVPDQADPGVLNRRQHAGRLRTRADVARMLVLEADGDAVPVRSFGEAAQLGGDGLGQRRGIDRPPPGKDSDQRGT